MMDCDQVVQQNEHQQAHCREGGDEWDVDGMGKCSLHCYRCGGLGHIASKCATSAPYSQTKCGGKGAHGKDYKGGSNAYGKNGLKGDSNGASGKEGRKGKGDWHGFCSYCGKKGHGPKDCWTKQRDEANTPSKMQISNVDEQDVSGFDIGCVFLSKKLDKFKKLEVKNSFEALEENEKEICSVDDERKRGRITVDSGAAESVWPQDLLPEFETKPSHGSKNGITYVAANGSRMPNMGEKKVTFETTDGLNSSIMFQVTKVKKPLATVSKITEIGCALDQPRRTFTSSRRA